MTIVVIGQQPESLSVTPVKEGLYYINGVGGNVAEQPVSAFVPHRSLDELEPRGQSFYFAISQIGFFHAFPLFGL